MITCEEVRQIFKYDPCTGELFRKGKRVGSPHSLGYLKIKVKGKTYFAHRLAYLYYHGYLPDQIDHMNRVKTDNRICNLRAVEYDRNNANREIMKSNTSGFKGVHFQRSCGYWRAQVGYDIIGHFKDKRDAALAYDKAALLKYGDSAVTNEILGLMKEENLK